VPAGAPSCPEYRQCFCKPGAEPTVHEDLDGCPFCACVTDGSRRRSILSAEAMTAENVDAAGSHLAAWLAAGVAMAVVSVVAIGVMVVRRKRSQTARATVVGHASHGFQPTLERVEEDASQQV
jgi:hypothetical protein